MSIFYKVIPVQFIDNTEAKKYGENFILKYKKEGEKWFGFTYKYNQSSWEEIIIIIISTKNFENSTDLLTFKHVRPRLVLEKETQINLKDTWSIKHHVYVNLFYRPDIFEGSIIVLEKVVFEIGSNMENKFREA